MADDLRASRAEHDALLARVEEIERKANEPPIIDEAVITARLGEHAAHILQSARDAEAEIRAEVPEISSILTHIESEPATIEPGEEITVDYNFEYVGDKTSCACGSSSCRSVMERMTPKLERDLAKQKTAARSPSAGRTENGRAGANGKLEPRAKSKAAHI